MQRCNFMRNSIYILVRSRTGSTLSRWRVIRWHYLYRGRVLLPPSREPWQQDPCLCLQNLQSMMDSLADFWRKTSTSKEYMFWKTLHLKEMVRRIIKSAGDHMKRGGTLVYFVTILHPTFTGQLRRTLLQQLVELHEMQSSSLLGRLGATVSSSTFPFF